MEPSGQITEIAQIGQNERPTSVEEGLRMVEKRTSDDRGRSGKRLSGWSKREDRERSTKIDRAPESSRKIHDFDRRSKKKSNDGTNQKVKETRIKSENAEDRKGRGRNQMNAGMNGTDSRFGPRWVRAHQIREKDVGRMAILALIS
jgi:hypothetical protein